jgi:hypothetical protein
MVHAFQELRLAMGHVKINPIQELRLAMGHVKINPIQELWHNYGTITRCSMQFKSYSIARVMTTLLY